MKVIVKTNQKQEKLLYDESKDCFIAYLKEEPKDNKANIALIKLFRKKLKNKVIIKKGLRNKEKILDIVK